MGRARLTLRFPREERREMVNLTLGSHWAENASREDIPVNLLSLYVNTVVARIVPPNPRVMMTTYQQEHKPIVNNLEIHANKEFHRMKVANTLRRVAYDAMYGIGVCKVALGTPADAARFSWKLEAGRPFIERVDLDDLVWDIHARDWYELGYIGHRFRAPLDVIKDSTIYSKSRKDLDPSTDPPYNVDGDERINMLGRGYYGVNQEEFEDFVDLWEIYIPRHNLIVTFSDDQVAHSSPGQDVVPLREQEWIGPYCGPYHKLGFQEVPGNMMPKGPVQDVVDLHRSVNNAYRKIIRQMQRQKQVLPVRSGATEDGDRTIATNDGEAFRCDGEPPIPVSYGGPDANMVVVANGLRELFKEMVGNMDSFAGLNKASNTATQEQIIEANSSKSLSSLQEAMTAHCEDVFRSLCWFWHHNPDTTMKVKIPIPGQQGMFIPSQITPEDRRQVLWDDLDIQINPYSMQYNTPAGRLQSIVQTLQTIVLPLAPIMQSQGVTPDMKAIMEIISRYGDLPELQECFSIGEPPQASEAGGSQGAPPMPAQTERTYNRVSSSERTSKGNNMMLMNAMLGVDSGGAGEQQQ